MLRDRRLIPTSTPARPPGTGICALCVAVVPWVLRLELPLVVVIIAVGFDYGLRSHLVAGMAIVAAGGGCGCRSRWVWLWVL